MKYTVALFPVLMLSELFSQGPVITGLHQNAALKKQTHAGTVKRNLPDTLQLPFMDDFTTTKVYPDRKYWMDSQVYVNDHFAVSPPSYGVATFDNLDKKGRPYQAINGFTHNHSDSLTSTYINLKNYKVGLNTVDYTPADSIYLSFFYQTQGLGDPLDGTDSLVLKFRDGNGFWKTVWKTTGSAVRPFRQVMVPVVSTAYLVPDFQFRFINFGKTTGNMNQWHIDYVRMNSKRNLHDTVVTDAALNAVPDGPLQWYESMPIDHYRANPTFNNAPQHRLILRNNFTAATNVQFKCEVRNGYGQLIKNYPLSSFSKNIDAQSDSSNDFTPLDLDTLSGRYPVVRLKYTIAPLANDFLPDDYNSSGNNNEYTRTLRFSNHFAYDDGSAEGGYGLDYGSLPAGPGYAAIKFTTFKPDTLRGISVFFNRSVSDVLFKSFTLMVWKQISEPPAPNTSGDVILKRVDMPSAIYTDSINGFTDIVFDTSVALPQGTFYIGWQQNTNFILNVGYDNNYKYAGTGGRNPNLFFNLNGYWEKVSGNITGTVMMRPLVGERLKPSGTSVRHTPSMARQIRIFPNPASGQALLGISSPEPVIRVSIYNANGQLMLQERSDDISSLDVSRLGSGMYLIELTDEKGIISRIKWINQP